MNKLRSISTHRLLQSHLLRLGSCLRPRAVHSSALFRSADLLSSNLRLKSLCESSRLGDARQLFDRMPLRDEYTWNTMITANARSGHLPEALRLFNASPNRDSTISWSFLIAAHSRRGQGPEAIELFRHMLNLGGPRADRYTLGSVLRACSSHCYLSTGRQVHALAIKSPSAHDGFVVAGLVDMYAKCRDLAEASRLFEAVPLPDRKNHVLWAAMITGHAQSGNAKSALRLFKSMRSEGVDPNQFVLPSVLAACAAEADVCVGSQVHGFVVHAGFESNDFVQCALVDMYAKCGDLVAGRAVLQWMDREDVVAWNSLLVGLTRGGRDEDVLSLFATMHRRGLRPDDFTYPVLLSCIGSANLVKNGRSVHGLLLKSGFEESHRHVRNALLDMYAKCESLDLAYRVFEGMGERDVVSWTALITGYAHHQSHEKALSLFSKMIVDGIESDEFLTAAVLSSCAGLAVLELGRQMHAAITRQGFDSFITVGNSLITMYAKCGCVDEACRVFDSMAARDVITWTALIVGYAQNGRGRESLLIYSQMVGNSSLRPDYVMFIGVLFACSHTGLVEEGRAHFESMEKIHGIAPGPEHYASMIDLLGRSGRIAEAAELLDRMPTPPDATVWKALLAACRAHRNNIPLAERAAKELFALDPTDAAPYVLLSNIYSALRMWGEVARVRGLMRSSGARKKPGWSWMEVGREVHVFRAEDGEHPRAAEIRAKVEEMMRRIKAAGHVTDTAGWALHEEEGEGKEKGLEGHSERLAVAFGLMAMPPGTEIRVFKNLRVCGDCHSAIKYVSSVYERRIVLRDANCFHHFGDGVCSCGDYW